MFTSQLEYLHNEICSSCKCGNSGVDSNDVLEQDITDSRRFRLMFLSFERAYVINSIPDKLSFSSCDANLDKSVKSIGKK
mmetsp:Transcript_10401/g.21384  ORF Transcript_10401/g.21384 Transcript_10401/m.21384 type:complete len:80 (+) Transcript_10401:56-295(+)